MLTVIRPYFQWLLESPAFTHFLFVFIFLSHSSSCWILSSLQVCILSFCSWSIFHGPWSSICWLSHEEAVWGHNEGKSPRLSSVPELLCSVAPLSTQMFVSSSKSFAEISPSVMAIEDGAFERRTFSWGKNLMSTISVLLKRRHACLTLCKGSMEMPSSK